MTFRAKTYLIIFIAVFLYACEQSNIIPDNKVLEGISELRELGKKHYKENDYKAAEKYFKQALEKAKTYKLTHIEAELVNNLASTYGKLDNELKCVKYNDEAINLFLSLGETIKVANSSYNLGRYYKNKKLPQAAQTCVLRAIELYEKLDKPNNLANTYNLMGLIQKDLNNYKEALSYHQKALEIRKQNNDQKKVSYSLQNLGVISRELREYDKALSYFQQSLEIKKKTGNKKRIAATHESLGKLYALLNQLKKSEEHRLEAFKLRNTLNNQEEIFESANQLGALYIRLRNLSEARKYLTTANTTANEINNNTELLIANHTEFKKLCEAENNKLESIEHSLEILRLKELEKKINPWKEEVSQKVSDQDKTIREKLAEIAEATKLSSKAIAGFVIAIIVAFYFWYSLQKIKKAQKGEEVVKKQLLDEHNIFKNQLQELSGLLNYTSSGIKEEAALTAIKEADTRMQAMIYVHKSILQKIGTSEHPTKFNLSEYIKHLINELRVVYSCHKINIKLGEEECFINEKLASPIGLIINEILSKMLKNSFKNIAAPELSVNVKTKNNNLHVQIISNGEKLPNDFEIAVRDIIKALKAVLVVTTEEKFSCVLTVPV